MGYKNAHIKLMTKAGQKYCSEKDHQLTGYCWHSTILGQPEDYSWLEL
jgi:hypothetical protein